MLLLLLRSSNMVRAIMLVFDLVTTNPFRLTNFCERKVSELMEGCGELKEFLKPDIFDGAKFESKYTYI
jgi:hypothetical protein